MKTVGIIGAGSFGTAIANLMAHNRDVLVYTRKEDLAKRINETHQHLGVELNPRIQATTDLKEMAAKCTLIYPIVPSANFRSMMQQLAPHLHPYHILIHGTKGFDITAAEGEKVTRKYVHTMSEVIRQESVVVRIGCLSGPNLAKEIMDGQPTGTVVGSKFREVIEMGKRTLGSKHFQVFGTHEILGAELAGALKNMIAIGSGVLGGLGMGKNIQALLLTRGLNEMINFGKAMGASPKAFLGIAGMGDLICTGTSENSRNYTFGKRLGAGETVEEINASMPELAEGIRTLEIAKQLADYYQLNVPITMMLYKAVFEGYSIETAIEFLMRYPNYVDVDFI